MATIAVINSQAGNVRSMEKALRYVIAQVPELSGTKIILSEEPAQVVRADALILPGVGAFGEVMQYLRENGLADAIVSAVQQGKPYLGVCLGMQVLFQESEEMGSWPGLALLPGTVRRFPVGILHVPQIGWNQLRQQHADPLLAGIPDGAYLYFVHSYYCAPAEPTDVVATTEYGLEYASLVRRDNIWGIQPHPEKSQWVGLRILRNFLQIATAGGDA